MGEGPVPSPAVRGASVDQTRLSLYRALAVVQVLAAGFFGVVPLVAPDLFASLGGYRAEEPLVIRLAGAGSFGYALVAFEALRSGASWHEQRIPLVATCTFNAAAAVGAFLSILTGEVNALVLFIAAAASVFTLICAYWLVRNEGPAPADDRPVAPWFRVTLVAATGAAAFFGIVPLLAPAQFAALFGLEPAHLFLYRTAGAAALGYATAGVLQVIAKGAAEIRLQVVGALAFNVLGALASLLYVLGGGPSPLGWLVLVAAGAFSVLFAAWLASQPQSFVGWRSSA